MTGNVSAPAARRRGVRDGTRLFPVVHLVYDGECGLCRRWVESWRERTGGAVDYVTAHEARSRFPWLSQRRTSEAVQLVRADGSVVSGARAVFETLATTGRGWLLLLYRTVPGFAFASEWFYRLVARHRHQAASLDTHLFGRRHRSLGVAIAACAAILAILAGAGFLGAVRVLRRRLRTLTD